MQKEIVNCLFFRSIVVSTAMVLLLIWGLQIELLHEADRL